MKEVQTRLGNLKAGTDDIKNHKWFQGFDFDLLLKRQMKAPWIPKVSSVTGKLSKIFNVVLILLCNVCNNYIIIIIIPNNIMIISYEHYLYVIL